MKRNEGRVKRFVEGVTRFLSSTGLLALFGAIPLMAAVSLWDSFSPPEYETRECSVIDVYGSTGGKSSDDLSLITSDCGVLRYSGNFSSELIEDMGQYINHRISVSVEPKSGYAGSVYIDLDSIEIIK